ncbi:transglutaminase family protein [Geomicrobium sp. JCM 19039]|uniref:transglutaminase family protein n=1 Tax=Geomicrobium sp. JCM 19039 TaxID=1460636 RepID=UPI00045F271E|nr:transglutaminase family protein [Geomicrobium sp. JCM 19039]GAK14316.1 transglutaminase-like domain protein [Geomicrobium sp. JCM 19039]
MKYEIVHLNRFDYDTQVDQSMNTIRLMPKTDECQRLLAYHTEITPHSLTAQHTDLWGNLVETFYIAETHTHLEVKTTSTVSIQRSPFVDQLTYSGAMQSIFNSQLFRAQYLPFLSQTNYTYVTMEQVQLVWSEIGNIPNPVQFAKSLMEYLYNQFTYDPTTTDVNTVAKDAIELKSGVCQDIAHVMIGVLRAQGIPARYLSGYLYVGEDSALVGDAASHAWIEFMAPGIGWIGLDPTNNVEALENHIRVGVGRDYADVSPVQGVYRGGNQNLDVSVSVTLLES